MHRYHLLGRRPNNPINVCQTHLVIRPHTTCHPTTPALIQTPSRTVLLLQLLLSLRCRPLATRQPLYLHEVLNATILLRATGVMSLTIFRSTSMLLDLPFLTRNVHAYIKWLTLIAFVSPSCEPRSLCLLTILSLFQN